MAAELTSQCESLVSLTQSAADHIRSLQSEQADNAGKLLRVYVEGGGCSGLQYGMVFDEKRDGDVATESFGVPVLVDATSAEYVRGAVIDYSDALTGGGFKINNPRAKSSCGCGKSFEAAPEQK
jgi:iron-sulfur cluster assembly accessory protein